MHTRLVHSCAYRRKPGARRLTPRGRVTYSHLTVSYRPPDRFGDALRKTAFVRRKFLGTVGFQYGQNGDAGPTTQLRGVPPADRPHRVHPRDGRPELARTQRRRRLHGLGYLALRPPGARVLLPGPRDATAARIGRRPDAPGETGRRRQLRLSGWYPQGPAACHGHHRRGPRGWLHGLPGALGGKSQRNINSTRQVIHKIVASLR